MDSLGYSFLMLVLVIALVPACLWCVRRLQGLAPAPAGRPLWLRAQLVLGPRERVVLVQAGTRLLVLGTTAQQVTLLCELPEGEAALHLAAAPAPDAQGAPQGASAAQTFSRLLQAACRRGPAETSR